MTSAYGLSATGETAQAYQALNSAVGATALINQTPCDVPKAFLNYILFDSNFENPQFGFKQVSSSAESAFEKLTLLKDIDEEGYLYIYVSNESSLNSNVYFDDLTITHEHSPLVQVNAYYPFGLQIEGLSYDRETIVANLYGFNSMEKNKELDLYSTAFRMYNPALARFNSMDPAASVLASYSPYHFSYNNPVNYSDPSGAFPGGNPMMGQIPPWVNEHGEDTRYMDENYGMDWNPFKTGRIGPGSGNHWSDQYSNPMRDYFLMSGGDFESTWAMSLGDFRDVLNDSDGFSEKNGQYGYYEDVGFTDYWIENGVLKFSPGVKSIFNVLEKQNREGGIFTGFGYHPYGTKTTSNGGSSAMDWVHGGLDVVGLIPGVGEIADGINALIYVTRGDYINAGLSAAAMIPFVGWGATGGKFIRNAIKYSDEVAAITKNTNRVNHIMQSHHGWSKLMANPTWDKVSPLIRATMEYGTVVPYKGVSSKVMYYNGFQIQATYKTLSNGTTAISDAWVIIR